MPLLRVWCYIDKFTVFFEPIGFNLIAATNVNGQYVVVLIAKNRKTFPAVYISVLQFQFHL